MSHERKKNNNDKTINSKGRNIKILNNGKNGILIEETITIREQKEGNIEERTEKISCRINSDGIGEFDGEPSVIPKEFFKDLTKHYKKVKFKSISIPDSVEIIESNAFEGCELLANIELGNGIRIIGQYAFKETRSLKIISFPNGIERINDGAFYQSGLVQVDLSKCDQVTTIGKSVFKLCNKLKEVHLPKGINVIPEECFRNCENLKQVYLSNPEEIKVGNRAFLKCKNYQILKEPFKPEIELQAKEKKTVKPKNELINESENTSSKKIKYKVLKPKYYYDKKSKMWIVSGTVKIPINKGKSGVGFKQEEIVCRIDNKGNAIFDEGVSIIPYNFLMWNNRIKRVTIPKSVQNIADGAFNNCIKLEKVIFAEDDNTRTLNSIKIGNRAFADCIKLHSVVFSNRIKQIGSGAFSKSGVKIADLSQCYMLERIGKGAFECCNNLHSISFPKTIDTIPNDCCRLCKSLENVTTYASRIGRKAFERCEDLQSFELLKKDKEKLEENEKKIDFTIGQSAFSGCEILEKIEGWEQYFGKRVYIYLGALYGCPVDLKFDQINLVNGKMPIRDGKRKRKIRIPSILIPFFKLEDRNLVNIDLEDLRKMITDIDRIDPSIMERYAIMIQDATNVLNESIKESSNKDKMRT